MSNMFQIMNNDNPNKNKNHIPNPYKRLTEQDLLTKLDESRENAKNGMYKDTHKVSRDIMI